MFGFKKKQQTERGTCAADVFDWDKVPDIDPVEVEKFLNATDAVQRNFPLAIALQVNDELVDKFTMPGKTDALIMAECRGGIKALKRFAQIYTGKIRIGDA